MMCVMHECEPYGHLSINGNALTESQAARMVGFAIAEYRRALSELDVAGVFSRNPSGVIFCRRMVKDEGIRNLRADAGRLGGNPVLLKQKDNQEVMQTDKQSPTPSSSSSSASKTLEPIVGQTPPDPTPLAREKGNDNRELNAAAVRIIAFLNDKTGAKFEAVPANVKLVVARLKEGFPEKIVRQVIANRCLSWANDPKMDEYLRPKTLFAASNFASYAGQIGRESPAQEAAP